MYIKLRHWLSYSISSAADTVTELRVAILRKEIFSWFSLQSWIYPYVQDRISQGLGFSFTSAIYLHADSEAAILNVIQVLILPL